MENKTVDIRFRVDKETKERWNKVTESKAINGSKLLRQYVLDWLKENDK